MLTLADQLHTLRRHVAEYTRNHPDPPHGADGRFYSGGTSGGAKQPAEYLSQHGETPRPIASQCPQCGKITSSWHPQAGQHLPLASVEPRSHGGFCPECQRDWFVKNLLPGLMRKQGMSEGDAMRHIDAIVAASQEQAAAQDKERAAQYQQWLHEQATPQRSVYAQFAERLRSIQLATEQRFGGLNGRVPLFALGADGKMHFAGSTAGDGSVHFGWEGVTHASAGAGKSRGGGATGKSGKTQTQKAVTALELRATHPIGEIASLLHLPGMLELRQSITLHYLLNDDASPYRQAIHRIITSSRSNAQKQQALDVIKRLQWQGVSTDQWRALAMAHADASRAQVRHATSEDIQRVQDVLKNVTVPLEREILEEYLANHSNATNSQQPFAIPDAEKGTLDSVSKTHIILAKGVSERIQSLFGRELELHEIASLVGAQPGDHVEVRPRGKSLKFVLIGANGIYSAERTLSRRGQSLTIHNDHFAVLRQRHGEGIGTRVFADQVRGAAALGIARIATKAARGESDNNNGYITWVKLGYDGRIPYVNPVAARPASINDAKWFHDIITSREGMTWWEEHGSTVDVVFDLRPGSYSRQILAAYLVKRNMDATGIQRMQQRSDAIDWTSDDEKAWREAIAELTTYWQAHPPTFAEDEQRTTFSDITQFAERLAAIRMQVATVTRNFEYTDSHGNVHLVTQGAGGKWTDNQIIEHAMGEGVTHVSAHTG